MTKLQFNTRDEEPLVAETAHAMQLALLSAQAKGLSLPAALKAIGMVIAQILATAYADPKKREIVIGGLPDLVRAMVPFFEKRVAAHRAALSPDAGKEG